MPAGRYLFIPFLRTKGKSVRGKSVKRKSALKKTDMTNIIATNFVSEQLKTNKQLTSDGLHSNDWQAISFGSRQFELREMTEGRWNRSGEGVKQKWGAEWGHEGVGRIDRTGLRVAWVDEWTWGVRIDRGGSKAPNLPFTLWFYVFSASSTTRALRQQNSKWTAGRLNILWF